MFIAMNRFQIVPGSEPAFEEVWRARDSRLADVPGFVEFRLLRGASNDEATLYASHTTWRDRDAFEAWTRSDNFREAHANAGDSKGLYLGRPQFEGFDTVLEG
tara:strand:+ start:9181 stop:9489 length:309 start_codon:yes stop_codon:yes gene_type:complete